MKRAQPAVARAWAAEDRVAAADAGERLVALRPDGRHSAEWWFDAALAATFARDGPRALRLGREAAVRVPRGRLDERLRELAAADHIPTSALGRRLLRQATDHRADALSTADVGRIARRIAREEIDLRS